MKPRWNGRGGRPYKHFFDIDVPPSPPPPPPVPDPVPSPGGTYDLPGVGAALYVAGQNNIQSVRPSTHTAFGWAYSLFGSFGSGSFVPSYSDKGAYVIAGSGGHNHPPNINCCLFDFADAQWKFLENSNGVAERNSTGSPNDWPLSALNGDPYYEVTGTQVPGPPHPYASSIGLPSSLGGGANGSYVYVTRAAIAPESVNSRGVHRFDLASRAWSRMTNNTSPILSTDSTALLDQANGRVFLFTSSYHSFQTLHYFDLADLSFKTLGTYPFPPDLSSGVYMLDTVRNIILAHTGSALRAINLANVSAGWVTLTVSGALPTAALTHWCYYPTTDRFYRVPASGGNTIQRLTPPASGPLTNPWTYDTVTLTGDTVPAYVDGGAVQSQPYRSLIHVPAISRLAWISGNNAAIATNRQVTLLNPT